VTTIFLPLHSSGQTLANAANVIFVINWYKVNIVLLTVRCSGQSPGEAEMLYLENAKNMALYGVHMHEALVCRLAFLICRI